MPAEKPNYEWAHVDGGARTRNNSPHNLLMLCLDCHTTQGSNELQLKDLKSAARRRFKLIHEKVAQVLFDGIVPGSRIAIVDAHDAWDHASLLVNELVGEHGTFVVDLPEGCER